jgi:nucleoid DNA-binding protein
MIKDKISSQEVIDLIASKSFVSKHVAEEFVKMLFSTIEEALLAGEVVKIKNFGTFKLQWNEPRKSVNVQTGEDIILAGYHKVSFAPDSILKEIVNEPFSHLEAVELIDNESDSNNNDTSEPILDPLRIFTDQATEIKNLLSEIQALSIKNPELVIEVETATADEELIIPIEIDEKTYFQNDFEEKIEEPQTSELIVAEQTESIDNEQVISKKIEKKKEQTEEEIEEPEKTEIIVAEQTESIDNEQVISTIIEKEIEQTEEKIEEPIGIEHTTTENSEEYVPNPFLASVKPPKKRKLKWLWIPLIFALLFGAITELYNYYPPANFQINDAITSFDDGVKYVKENLSITDMLNTITGWFVPATPKSSDPEVVIVPKDTVNTDTIKVEKPVDSLQILFDTPRVYPSFIASERIVSGSRLARMSFRYYGCSDFWVYIYEANKDRFENPDKIPSGVLIHIPKLNPLLIDASNPRCIKKARELHNLYVKKTNN